MHRAALIRGLKLALIDSDLTQHALNCIVIARGYRQLGKISFLLTARQPCLFRSKRRGLTRWNAHVHQPTKASLLHHERNLIPGRNTAQLKCSVAAAVGKGDGATTDGIATQLARQRRRKRRELSRLRNIDHRFGERIDSVWCVDCAA
jgi:hypothetical protein